MDTKERLKHASEVLGWLAEGKEIQLEMKPGEWETRDPKSSPENTTYGIVNHGWIYRIKPEPVEWCAHVQRATGNTAVYLPEDLFQPGQRVKVTVLES